jgi:hypothetical protein
MNILKEEKNRMQELAGLIKEDDKTSNKLEHGIGLVLKVDDSLKESLISLEIPEEPRGNEMTKLPNDKLHTTLTSIRSFKPFRENFENFTLPEGLNVPNAIFGTGKFVYRDEQDKVTYVISIENQNEFKNFVDEIYKSLGLENPEPDRFFHITVANNAGGNSFKSIGNVTEKDFN